MYIPIQIKYGMIISIKNKKFKVCVLFVGFFFQIYWWPFNSVELWFIQLPRIFSEFWSVCRGSGADD